VATVLYWSRCSDRSDGGASAVEQYPLLYEVRSHNPDGYVPAILDVLDAEKIRMNVGDRDTLGHHGARHFMVNCNRRKHIELEPR